MQTVYMFLASERIIDVPWQAARARLVNLAEGGGLSRVSHSAYQRGLKGVIRVGPLGDVPGVSKLVAVRFLEPLDRGVSLARSMGPGCCHEQGTTIGHE